MQLNFWKGKFSLDFILIIDYHNVEQLNSKSKIQRKNQVQQLMT